MMILCRIRELIYSNTFFQDYTFHWNGEFMTIQLAVVGADAAAAAIHLMHSEYTYIDTGVPCLPIRLLLAQCSTVSTLIHISNLILILVLMAILLVSTAFFRVRLIIVSCMYEE